MKLFLDENESPAIIPVLRSVYFDHEFRSAQEEGLLGVDDVDLLDTIGQRGFHAIITRDRAQLADHELDALLRNGLHWLGHSPPRLRGAAAVAYVASAYLTALPHVFPELTAAREPMKVAVRNIPHVREQRIKPVRMRTLLRDRRPLSGEAHGS